jgi:hypothetical protein
MENPVRPMRIGYRRGPSSFAVVGNYLKKATKIWLTVHLVYGIHGEWQGLEMTIEGEQEGSARSSQLEVKRKEKRVEMRWWLGNVTMVLIVVENCPKLCLGFVSEAVRRWRVVYGTV